MLNGSNGPVLGHAGKARILLDRFKGIMGTPFLCTNTLNWEALGMPSVDLAQLDVPFSEQELRDAVTEIHGEKAPGPDGFTGAFYKRCWQVIKGDLLE